MNVLFASAEVVPFAKVGGMGDVVGALPGVLRRLGTDARIIMPGYDLIPHDQHQISHLFSFDMTRKTGTIPVRVFTTVVDSVPIYFIQGLPFFGDESSVYSDWAWDVPRFIFFNQAVMAVAEELDKRLGWFPDTLHVNDWHTGLIPFLLAEKRHDPRWAETGSLISIHNIAYQGGAVGGWLWELGIPGRHHPDLVYQDLTDNLLAIGIAYADIVTTVSPRYAIEIQYPYAGFGLDGLIRARQPDVYGVLNGLDTARWNPATDPTLTSNFDARDFITHRPPNKRHLQSFAGLEIRDTVPVIGMVTRLAWQKGLDLALPALRRLLLDTDVQLIVLGAGDVAIAETVRQLARDFGWRARAFLTYDGALAQHIYAGCDIFLMPSHFEPCGIGQMIAMRYGALPLVRETGGLADTVTTYDNGPADQGTGFVFSWEEVDAVLGTIRWALDTYHTQQLAWQRMQRRAMQTDFSWENSARQYANLYQKAHDKHREAVI